MVIIIARQQFTLTQTPFLMRKFQNSILPPPYKSRAKVGKIGKFFCLLICVLTFATNVVTAQSKLWLHGNKVINLSDSYNITVSDLPTPSGPTGLVYDGSLPALTGHVEYDPNGNILFFMIDGKIYNKDGYLLVKEESIAGHLYEFYPEKMLTFSIIKVPNDCSKFYILSNFNQDGIGLGISENRHFFIGLLDLNLTNIYFPNDIDRKGALVNWESVLPQYPVNLNVITNFSSAPNYGLDGARCGNVINLNSSPSPVLQSYTVNFPLFSASQNGPAEVFLNTSHYTKSFNWKLTATGLTYLGQNTCNYSENDVVFYYENRSIADVGTSSKLMVNSLIVGASWRLAQIDLGGQVQNCNTSLYPESVIQGELSSDGTYYVWFTLSGLLRYSNTSQGESQAQSFPNISTIPNLSHWSRGCRFNRNVYQGVESIYVFHSGGIDIIKGINQPSSASLISNVINVPSPLSNSFALAQALPNAANVNLALAITGIQQNAAIVVAPVQVYNRIDEIIPTAQCCVFETNYNAEGNIIVNSNQTWTASNNPFNNSSGPIHVSGDIIIEAGRTLTINNLEIRFAENSDVVISAGAYLRIENNSKLTSYACEGKMWNGIDLLSSPNLNQAFVPAPAAGVGRIQINDSTIEHALRGVEVGTTNSNAGGLIRTINATFLNCQVGVVFKAYSMTQLSQFGNSKWITNQKLKDPNQLLGSMVHLQGVKGTVRFTNCAFVNNAGIHEYNMINRQTGIHCSNSSISVQNLGSSPMPYNSASDLGRAFYGLKSGIVYSGTSTSTLSVTKMAFDECNTGLQVTNATGAIINDNFFDIPVSAAISNVKPRGSILTGCTGFSYERNSFQAASFNAQTQNVGSMFVNCGDDNNLSYRNTYSNLWKGQEVQGNNADPLASIGLQLRCNTYTNCQYDQ